MTSESAYREGYNNPRVTRFPVRYPSGISGRRGYLDDKEDKRTKVTTSGVERGQDLGRPRLIKVKPKSETLIPKEEEVNWSFGYMLRYLIIIIIIIALVVFFGGQALQVSKST